ncbi:MAG: hypothetical protein EXR69_14890 [Myxococcales bacterium]|nr:hypothetical protein [Myxococcales bacterium]
MPILASFYAVQLLVASASAAPTLHAAAEASGTDDLRITYKAITELDIENSLVIEGATQRPTGTFTFEARRVRFNPIIELRANFEDRAEASIGQVR